MKITTVSLNPAIDQTVRVDGFRVDTINRGASIRFEAAGKGVNVASFLADSARLYGLDLHIAVTGFLGRDNAGIFEDLFARLGVDDRFVRIPGATRIGVKLVDETAQQTTDINLPGLSPTQEAIDLLERTLLSLAFDCDLFVLTGSLPPGLSLDYYAQLIRMLKAPGRRVMLDTSGTALSAGFLSQPSIIKLNLTELSELSGRTLEEPPAVAAAARRLLVQRAVSQNPLEMVIVSMDPRGALFVTPGASLHAIPPAVTLRTTVGAGDALVAGLLVGQARGLDLTTCACLATAFSLLTITTGSRQLRDVQALAKFANQVQVQVLE